MFERGDRNVIATSSNGAPHIVPQGNVCERAWDTFDQLVDRPILLSLSASPCLRGYIERPMTDIHSTRAAEPVGAFPHAKRVGNLLFLSGIGPRKRGSKDIPGVTLNADGTIRSYDIETQCRAVFDNVRYVLEDAGSKWENIVDVQVFLTNMKDDFAAYNKLYAEYFAGPGKPNPTRTTIEINCLPTPIAIELKVIATI